MTLNLYVHVRKGKLVVSSKANSQTTLPDLHRQDKLNLRVQFVDDNPAGGIQTPLSIVSVSGLTLRAAIGDAGTPLALQTTFTADGANNWFTGSLELNTTEMETALTAASPSSISKTFELELIEGTDKLTFQFPVTIKQDVIRTGAPSPSDYDPPSALADNIALVLLDSPEIDVVRTGDEFKLHLLEPSRRAVHVVADETARLALAAWNSTAGTGAKTGDVAIQTDTNRAYELTDGSDPSTAGNWTKLPVGFEWQGPWASGTSYVRDDAVSRTGSAYIAIAPSTGKDPADPANIGVYWDVFATGSSMQPSDATPAALAVAGTASPGTSADGSRADHKHAMPGLATSSTDGFQSKEDKARFNRTETGGADGEVKAALLAGSSIYLAGGFTKWDNVSLSRMAKVDLRLKVDPHFNPGTGFSGTIQHLAQATDGDIFAGGPAKTTYNGGASSWIHKIEPTGAADATWPAIGTIAAVGSDQLLGFAQLNGRLAALSWRTLRILNSVSGVTLYSANGDVNLHNVRSKGDYVYLTSRQAAQYDANLNPRGVKKLYFPPNESDPAYGDIDATWAANAGTGSDASCDPVAIAPDGLSLVVGTNGSAYSGLGNDWNGAGAAENVGLLRLNSDGTLDTGWDCVIAVSGAEDHPIPFAIDGSGRVYFGGPVTSINGTSVTPNRLYRVDADGSNETEFDGFNGTVNGLLRVDDSKLLAFGAFTQYGQLPVGRVVAIDDTGARIHDLTGDADSRTGVYREEWIDAGMMLTRSWQGATAVVREFASTYLPADAMRFATGANEHAVFKAALPDVWNRLAVKVKLIWEPASGATPSTVCRWKIRAGSRGDGDLLDVALGSWVQVDDTTIAHGQAHVSAASAEITIAGSPALGDVLFFEVQRAGADAGDTLNVAADLLGIHLQFLESTTEPAAW